MHIPYKSAADKTHETGILIDRVITCQLLPPIMYHPLLLTYHSHIMFSPKVSVKSLYTCITYDVSFKYFDLLNNGQLEGEMTVVPVKILIAIFTYPSALFTL